MSAADEVSTLMEAERVRDLYELVDPEAPADDLVDDIVAAAADAAGSAMAAVNLFDAERQCAVGARGYVGEASPREQSMCNVSVVTGAFVYTPDARLDSRFAANPWVDGRRGDIRFYASAPLMTDRDHVLGTLCVFDTEPHELTSSQIDRLQQLADHLVSSWQYRAGRHGR